MSETSLTSYPTAPFDFQASLRFLEGFPATEGEQIVGDGSLLKAFRESGVTMAARVSGAGTVDDPRLECRVSALGEIPRPAAESVRDRVGFFLGVDDDLTEFYRSARADPAFSAVVDQLYGYHQVKFPSPIENLCWAVLSQRTRMPIARRAKAALLHRFNNRITVGTHDLWAFPDLAQLLTLTPQAWADLVGSERKGSFLHGIARKLDDEDFLRNGPYDKVKDFLLGLPGIGPWSASFVLIRGLGRTEEIGANAELVRAASAVYGRRLSDEEFRELAEGYGSWQGYWAHYLRAAQL